jgi:uncharacterized protein (TIGR02118 family)
MMKITALYTPPSDPAAFDEHYVRVHIPLASTLPGLVRMETARQVGTPDGSPPPYHRTAELYFEDMAAVGAAFASEEGRATAKDANDLAARTGSSMTLMISEVDAG